MARFGEKTGSSSGKKPGKKPRVTRGSRRFPERAKDDWKGPLVSYREVELLRKFMTSSSKVMSRKRGGTSSKEQNAIQAAIKQARFIGLVPYAGT